MPNGKTHSILTVIASAAMFSASNYFKSDLPISLSLAAGGLLGLIIHPDLDQAESRKGLWNRIWWPYGKIIKHRDTWSHAPVLSTGIRLIYIFTIPVFILWWYVLIENWPLIYLVWYVIIGLMVADTIHFLADVISTKIKRIF